MSVEKEVTSCNKVEGMVIYRTVIIITLRSILHFYMKYEVEVGGGGQYSIFSGTNMYKSLLN